MTNQDRDKRLSLHAYEQMVRNGWIADSDTKQRWANVATALTDAEYDKLAAEWGKKAELLFQFIIDLCDQDETDSIGVALHLLPLIAEHMREAGWSKIELLQLIESLE